MRAGRGHVDEHENAWRIQEDIPFPPFDVFVDIVTTDPRRLLDRFHALGIHTGGTWVRMPSLSFAFSPVQRPQQERPGPFEEQPPEMVKDGLARREIGREIAPRTTSTPDVKDRVENGSQRVGRRSSVCGRRWQVTLEALPLCIGEITGIGDTHLSILPHGVPLHVPENGQKPSGEQLLR